MLFHLASCFYSFAVHRPTKFMRPELCSTSLFSSSCMLLHVAVFDSQISLSTLPWTVQPKVVFTPWGPLRIGARVSSCFRSSMTFAPINIPTSLQSKFFRSRYCRWAYWCWCWLHFMHLLFTLKSGTTRRGSTSISLLLLVVGKIWHLVLITASFGSLPWKVANFMFVRFPLSFRMSARSLEMSEVSHPGSSKSVAVAL